MPIRKEENKDSYRDLGDFSFLNQEYVDKIHDIFDTYFAIGIARNKKPISSSMPPTFPSGVSSLSSSELGNIHGEFAAWHGFIADRLKYYTVAMNVVREEVEKAFNDELAEMVSQKGNIKAKEAFAKNSDEYVALKGYLLKISATQGMLSDDLKSYDKSIAVLSREISRREANAGY